MTQKVNHEILKKGATRRTASVKELNLKKLEKGLRVFFNASTLSLVPSRNSGEILLRSLSPEYADGTLMRSMWNTACRFSTSRRNLVACSKWAHLHFSSGYAILKLISARRRSTEMCPCDEECKSIITHSLGRSVSDKNEGRENENCPSITL